MAQLTKLTITQLISALALVIGASTSQAKVPVVDVEFGGS